MESVDVWEHRQSFGAYLRQVRQEQGLTLRAASEYLGLSYSYLSKLETGARKSPPSMKALRRIATAYFRDIREVMYEAGFRSELLPDLVKERDTLDARFHRLVSHPGLHPPRMNRTVEECISPLVKSMWIDFALKLWEAAEEGGEGCSLHIPMLLSGMLDEDGISSFELDDATGFASKIKYSSNDQSEVANGDSAEGDEDKS